MIGFGSAFFFEVMTEMFVLERFELRALDSRQMFKYFGLNAYLYCNHESFDIFDEHNVIHFDSLFERANLFFKDFLKI